MSCTERFGSKGAALSHVTIGLLREVMDVGTCDAVSRARLTAVDSPVFALCDKHGGRNRYAALLQHHFSEHWIEPVCESHAESRYEWGPPRVARALSPSACRARRFCRRRWRR